MFRRLYDWTLALAESRHSTLALAGIAFAESSFFPLPPDLILLPMSLAKPQKAWFYAAVCTIASVAGGVLGYVIGAALYDTLGHYIIQLYGYGSRIDALRAFYAHWGWAFILVKGLTPIPFKLVTIVSGLLGYNLPLFVLLALITRGARFFLLAAAMNHFGDQMRVWLDKHFAWFVIILFAIIVFGFWAAAHLV
ncbi:DedA family protein [Rhodoblastus acidophilus]|jgi:membrane protein YqaA with SNARE-associated domain|uniref:DedA family protein n=1 Tax=Candidatus Rhodoblastus alkanivorans TaxID=2954117 RepID=A0ABS9ZC62_9HYPH|nr:DedA family protein [Candidatus Rhodoblastus alkanivorans]MCI4677765.1 DedA family protein [Candidatus Rhodoblastus alkanivorans]MCI4684737.1 DedA family protein [Candidatus Rhodoblastus alkanivorans]MDI4642059.1 DedA family protein [Rhodoblastus acidophilus]